jgi:hypothetical protein
MKRIIIICEGQTEQAFCETNLKSHMWAKGKFIQTPKIKVSNGGIVKWPALKQQIENHLKTEPNAIVTTFIDYYGLYSKHGFPQWSECEKIEDRNARMESLESCMQNDIREDCRYRFIPYLQLHEFEGLLFSAIEVFDDQIPNEDMVGRKELEEIFQKFDNPEMINNKRDTSPSHRLDRIIKGYNKVVYGNILADAIGLYRIRSKCPRFNGWIHKLENV